MRPNRLSADGQAPEGKQPTDPLSLTICCTPKRFDGQFRRIQLNAFRSWAALDPRPFVMVFGSESGTREVCEEFGFTHFPEVKTSPSGIPYLDDLLTKARAECVTSHLGYVNADIILLSDFVSVFRECIGLSRDAAFACSPINFRLERDLDTAEPLWEELLRQETVSSEAVPTTVGADVFVLPLDSLTKVPQLAIGAYWFDFWFLWRIAFSRGPGIDTTPALLAIHQDHSESSHTHASNRISTFDSDQNARFLRWWQRLCWRVDLPYEMTSQGVIRRRFRMGRISTLLRVTRRQFSRRQLTKAWFKAMKSSYQLRRRLRLYRFWKEN